MYIIDGIAYAGEPEPELKVCGIRPMDDYRLWIRFSTGETKVFDFIPLLETPAFAALKSPDVFRSVYIDYGIPVWKDGEIDIGPMYLYENAVSSDSVSA